MKNKIYSINIYHNMPIPVTAKLEYVATKINSYGDTVYYFKLKKKHIDTFKSDIPEMEEGKLPYFETPEGDLIFTIKEKFIEDTTPFIKNKSCLCYLEFTYYNIEKDSKRFEGWYINKLYDFNSKARV